jgi:hypothetical protein
MLLDPTFAHTAAAIIILEVLLGGFAMVFCLVCLVCGWKV